MKNIFLFFVAILSLSAIFLEGTIIYNDIAESPEPVAAKKVEAKIEQEFILPTAIDLDVPFVAQAPNGDWSYPFPSTCEEATLLMAHYFLEGSREASVAQSKIELLALVDFENKEYGYHEDTNVDQTAKVMRDYYSHNVMVVYDISMDDIKKELALGRPVIIPTAGRLLQNPNFKPPGPVYHMILLKGYNQDGFISHDPGTAKGENVVYSYTIIENALHDLVEGDITSGRRAMIAI